MTAYRSRARCLHARRTHRRPRLRACTGLDQACVERKRVDTDQHVLLLRFKLLCSVPGSRAARSAARSDVKFNLLTGSLICLTTVILLPRLTTAGT